MVTAYSTTADAALVQAEWLPLLFCERPTRSSLLPLRPVWQVQKAKVRMHRNMASELIASLCAPYLAFAGFEVDWEFGAYDDSLTFASVGTADVELIWLDYSRFENQQEEDFKAWLLGRLSYLRGRTQAPILINSDPRSGTFNSELMAATDMLPGVYVCQLGEVVAATSEKFFDKRNHEMMGLPYSNTASVMLGRELGSRWLPSVFLRGLKAIVVDLDQTLYGGVLGEDGSENVELTDKHLQLQQTLIDYREQGIFLGICSKNEAKDVWEMFDLRKDFLVRPEHLSAHAISWQSKAKGLRTIARELRVGLDSILYIDDNPGELASIVAELPEIRVLHAGSDPAVTTLALRYYPGLHRWRIDKTDHLRIQDLAASAARAELSVTEQDPESYLRSLKSRVTFRVDDWPSKDRLQSLSTKTNQFNLNLRRLGESDVAEYLTADGRHAVAVELADRLSDSGVIAAIFIRLESDTCSVEECCISCRALGRGLEDLLVLGALRAALPNDFRQDMIRFDYVLGPRNAPALDWLANLVGRPLSKEEGAPAVKWSSCLERLAKMESILGADNIFTT